jgi:ESS family glutamate:Na+ symporter
MVARGGVMLALLTVFAVANNVIQDLVAVAKATGAAPVTCILAGSAALAGGHGTVIAGAPTLAERFGMGNAMEFGIAVATFGLVAGGILGGPIGHHLIRRNDLSGSAAEHLSVGATYAEESKRKLDAGRVLNALLVIAIAMGLGTYLNDLIAGMGLVLQQFVTALFSGILLSNLIPAVLPRLRWPTGTRPLAMSLMSLQLWTLLGAAGPLFAIPAVQVVVACVLAVFVLFPLLGRTYDAAVAAAGFFGLGLGATPT